MTLADCARVVRRHLLVVVVLPLALLSLALYFSSRQQPLYAATVEVLLTQQEAINTVVGGADASSPLLADRSAATQAVVASVPQVAERAIAEVGAQDLDANELLDSTTVTPAASADVLEFEVVDGDADRAERLAAAMARAYAVHRAELDIAAIDSAREGLEGRLARLRESSGGRPGLRDALIEDIEALETLAAVQVPNAVLRTGSDEAQQIQPHIVRNAALGGFLGLVLAVLWLLVREAFDKRLRFPDEIERHLVDLPLLAELPRPSRRLRRDHRLVMLTDPLSPEAEPYRMLRANLRLATQRRRTRTILFTSALDGEGKSTIVANLAIAEARGGRRVVLVDLDLRQPSLHQLFDVQQAPGLTDVALGAVRVDDALVYIDLDPAGGAPPSGDHNGLAAAGGELYVLPSGALSVDSPDLIASTELDDVLSILKQADVVLLDAPPMLSHGDARTLSGKVDAVVVVVREGVARRDTTDHLRQILESSPAAKLGFVASNAPTRKEYGVNGHRPAHAAASETLVGK